jgi:hypothetical protein
MEGLLKTFGALTKDAPNDWEYFPAKIQSRAGGGRTHTVSPPADFKSAASANSATAPRAILYLNPDSLISERAGQLHFIRICIKFMMKELYSIS